jgi:hypothetical protein
VGWGEVPLGHLRRACKAARREEPAFGSRFYVTCDCLAQAPSHCGASRYTRLASDVDLYEEAELRRLEGGAQADGNVQADDDSAWFNELHSQGWTLIKKGVSLRRCNALHRAVKRETYSPIFNGEASGEEQHRFAARGESWAPSVERDQSVSAS